MSESVLKRRALGERLHIFVPKEGIREAMREAIHSWCEGLDVPRDQQKRRLRPIPVDLKRGDNSGIENLTILAAAYQTFYPATIPIQPVVFDPNEPARSQWYLLVRSVEQLDDMELDWLHTIIDKLEGEYPSVAKSINTDANCVQVKTGVLETPVEPRLQRTPIPEVVLARLRDLPAKSEKHRQAKIIAYEHRRNSSGEIANMIQCETGLQVSSSRVRQMRNEVNKWVLQGAQKTLSKSQDKKITEIVEQLRTIYHDIPPSVWRARLSPTASKKALHPDSEGLEADVRNEVTIALLETGNGERAKAAGRRVIDQQRQEFRKRDLEADPDAVDLRTRTVDLTPNDD